MMPGNEASIYTNILDKGMIKLTKGEVKKVVITAKDYFNNSCKAEFYISSNSTGKVESAAPVGILFKWNDAGSWKNGSISISVDAKSLYEDLYMTLDSSSAPAGALSNLFKIHNEYTPLHKAYKLSIKTNALPQNIPTSKLIIVRLKSNGDYVGYTSSYHDNYVTAEPKEFGNFCVMADTTAPLLTANNLKNGQILQSKTLSFTLSDKLSGIESYNFYLDDKWIIADYDAKSNTVKVELGPLSKGEHILKAVVSDKVQNKKTYTYKFNTL
jgi:hypothetical protein